MQSTHQPDNLFGICHRVGADFGFDPLWLRLGFAAAFLFAPAIVTGCYLALGALVLASRALFPVRRRRAAAVVPLPMPAAPAAHGAAPLARAA